MDPKQNGKRAVIVVLVILLAYVVVLFDQRSVGKATFQRDTDTATDFVNTIEEDLGGQVVEFPTSEGDAQLEGSTQSQALTPKEQAFLERPPQGFTEQPSFFSIENLFEGATSTFSASDAKGFMAAIRRLGVGASPQNKATTATDIANLFKIRLTNSGIRLSQNANSFIPAIKSGGR